MNNQITNSESETRIAQKLKSRRHLILWSRYLPSAVFIIFGFSYAVLVSSSYAELTKIIGATIAVLFLSWGFQTPFYDRLTELRSEGMKYLERYVELEERLKFRLAKKLEAEEQFQEAKSNGASQDNLELWNIQIARWQSRVEDIRDELEENEVVGKRLASHLYSSEQQKKLVTQHQIKRWQKIWR